MCLWGSVGKNETVSHVEYEGNKITEYVSYILKAVMLESQE